MKPLDVIVAVLVCLGAINWGLIGIFDFNFIDFVFGKTIIDKIIYIIVGLSGLYQALLWRKIGERWKH